MTAIDHVATLLNQLDDMETIFRFHNLRHRLRVCQTEGNIRKLWHIRASTCKAQLTTLLCRCLIFRIQQRQGRELRTAVVDSLCITTQFILHPLDLLYRNARLTGDDLALHLRRDERDTVLWQVLEVTAHLGRSHLDVLHQTQLHLPHQLLISVRVEHLFTYLRQALAHILLQLLPRTKFIQDGSIQIHVHLLKHISIRHRH